MKNLIEDLCVFVLITTAFLSPFLILFGFILLSYYWSLRMTLLISLIYGSWMYIDRYTDVQGGRWSNRLRRSVFWSMIVNYFPIRLIKTEDLDTNRNYIFGYHPHGAFTFGGLNFITEATHFSTLFPSIRPHVMSLRYGFLIPIVRELYLYLGNL